MVCDAPCSLLMLANIIYNHVGTGQGRFSRLEAGDFALIETFTYRATDDCALLILFDIYLSSKLINLSVIYRLNNGEISDYFHFKPYCSCLFILIKSYPMHVEILRDDYRNLWNEFVAKNNGHVLQSFEWGKFKGSGKWKPFILALRESNEITAGISLVARTLPLFGLKLLYAPRGPVVQQDPIFDCFPGHV